MTSTPTPDTGPGSAFFQAQADEHAAWKGVVSELRRLNVGQINAGEPHERLHDLIVAWGEELSELRRLDPEPEHGERALAERRAKIDTWHAEAEDLEA